MRRSCTWATARYAIWVGYLALAVVFAQGMNLHIHIYDHEPLTADDVHVEKVHPAITKGTAHSDQGDEVDLSVQGIVKHVSLHFLIAALLTTAGLLLIFHANLILTYCPRLLCATGRWRDQLPPPLRAPPA